MICALDKEPSAVLNMFVKLVVHSPESVQYLPGLFVISIHLFYMPIIPLCQEGDTLFFFHYLHNLLVLLRLLKFPMIGQHRAEPGVCNSPGTR